jgi:putative DNA methylase
MTQKYPKRLIEVDLPIKRISAHARREKSIRHGHISTLHIWWARRPLAACRAVICASLWPDPADPLCQQVFRDKASEIISNFARAAVNQKELGESCDHETWIKWQALAKRGGLDSRKEAHWNILRFALLDFIADFANWDNSTVQEYLDTSRALTQAAHEALGGEPGTRPLVVDPFAGGGSIPLEALRVGADAFASDLNPIPVLLNKVVLEYIPKYGQRLADEVRKWGDWIKQEAEKELAEFYPKDADGATPIAYLWARTIQCEGPGCGAEIPLLRTLIVAKRSSNVQLEFVIDQRLKQIGFAIAGNNQGRSVGTVKGGAANCPVCHYTTPSASVRRQLAENHGGVSNARLYAVVLTQEGSTGRKYRLPTLSDAQAISQAQSKLASLINEMPDLLPSEALPPERPSPNARGLSPVARIGIRTFADLFSARATLALLVYSRLVRRAMKNAAIEDKVLAQAIAACLAFAVDKQADFNSSLSRWANHMEKSVATFGRQALPILWDWGEVVPTSKATGSFVVAVDWISNALEQTSRGLPSYVQTRTAVLQTTATRHPLPDDSADAIVTDPPYYDAVPYADLSDYFYVWIKRTLSDAFPELINESLTPKDEEAIWNPSRIVSVTGEKKDEGFYERQMFRAFTEARRVVRPDGIGVVVFAHKSTAGWEAILQALIGAGWVATGSWSIDTEKADRMNAQGTASLASSVHIICRPRETADGDHHRDTVGDWRDVLQELPLRIHEWMPRLASEGVVGADAIFACIGPALEVFSRYSRVEKANGEPVALGEYLEHVWAAVAKEALALVFEGADATGFEADARLTAMWLWTLKAPDANGKAENGDDDSDDEQEGKKPKVSGFKLEYDAARKIAQGLGADLEGLTHLVEIAGDQARLLPVSERTKHLFGKEEEEPVRAGRKKKSSEQLNMFAELTEAEDAEVAWKEKTVKRVGETTLDRVHQAMILFAAGRGEALKRFVVEDGVGQDGKFWRLAQALSALYPSGTDEKRWVDGLLARKKQFGF